MRMREHLHLLHHLHHIHHLHLRGRCQAQEAEHCNDNAHCPGRRTGTVRGCCCQSGREQFAHVRGRKAAFFADSTRIKFPV